MLLKLFLAILAPLLSALWLVASWSALIALLFSLLPLVFNLLFQANNGLHSHKAAKIYWFSGVGAFSFLEPCAYWFSEKSHTFIVAVLCFTAVSFAGNSVWLQHILYLLWLEANTFTCFIRLSGSWHIWSDGDRLSKFCPQSRFKGFKKHSSDYCSWFHIWSLLLTVQLYFVTRFFFYKNQ